MAAKSVFNAEQAEAIRQAAVRVWNLRFKSKGKTQEEMALALGLSQQSVSNLLRGTYKPGLATAKEVALLDGTTLEDLVGDYAGPAPGAVAAAIDGTAFPNLEACVRFHLGEKEWMPWTLAAARAGFYGKADFPASQWTSKLDKLEALLEKGRAK